MTFLTASASPGDQLSCAQIYIRERYPPSTTSLWRGERYRHERIRLAYVSSDFRTTQSRI
jgi:hypothetical protein